MNWKRISTHVLAADNGYKICRIKIDRDIYYRPSLNGSFICAPQSDLDEAKGIYERHAQENLNG